MIQTENKNIGGYLDEFAKTLAGQAGETFPQDLPEELKKFVIQVVYDFIKVAGNALSGEQQEYSEDATALICQLVGEWMYHKGIDNYKNEIPEEFWKPILQQIAFAIFETAKKAVLEGKQQDEIITLVEATVTSTYRALIEQLAQQNKLKKSVDEIMHQSNLNDYVEQKQEEEISPEQEEKGLKLATMALFFKTLTPKEVGVLVKMLGPDDRKQIVTYMGMKDLERLVDQNLYNEYLQKFHNFMPKVQMKKKKNLMFNSINKAFSELDDEKFNKIFGNERINVKNFLLRIYNGKMYEEDLFSSEITNTIIEYATQKAGN